LVGHILEDDSVMIDFGGFMPEKLPLLFFYLEDGL
jgi:hypothetical protein